MTPTTSAQLRVDEMATEWDASPESSCEVIVGQFVWGVQRCMARAYKVINVDGDPWAICREHYDAAGRK